MLPRIAVTLPKRHTPKKNKKEIIQHKAVKENNKKSNKVVGKGFVTGQHDRDTWHNNSNYCCF